MGAALPDRGTWRGFSGTMIGHQLLTSLETGREKAGIWEEGKGRSINTTKVQLYHYQASPSSHQTWQKGSFVIRKISGLVTKKGNAKECSNYCTIALISHASKVMLKILQDRLQQYMNRELLDVQAGFRKARGTRDQIANICWIIEKAGEFQKSIYFCFIDYA